MALVCVESPGVGIEPMSPASAGALNHWATREAPDPSFCKITEEHTHHQSFLSLLSLPTKYKYQLHRTKLLYFCDSFSLTVVLYHYTHVPKFKIDAIALLFIDR